MAKKALLIGAGFSFDLGMPIAKGYTKDLFHFLNLERLKKYTNIWKNGDPYGLNRPIDPKSIEEVNEIYKKYYYNSDSNYEDFLKEIQDEYFKLGAKQDLRDSLHFVFGIFLDIVFQMFWMYHVNNLGIYMMNKKFYNSLLNLISDEELWVLSLNHDLFIEFLCFDNNIPLSFGYRDEISLPESNYNYDSSISFGRIYRNDMQLDKMGFIRGEKGVNLIKIHGAINEFSYDDDEFVIHINPKNETVISYLEKTNKVLHEMCYYINGTKAKTGREIAVSDFEGKMQFLRKSIQIGGYKYRETIDPKPGEEKIHLMEEVLSIIDEITIIGYGFGDKHINLRLYNAMLQNKNLKIWIVDPFRSIIPEILKPFDYQMRIRCARCGAPEWLSYLKDEKWNTTLLKEIKEVRLIRETWDKEYRIKYLSP